MTRSSSAEPPKASSSSTKRKGTRSVSTLTPSQLARKRANDREAQRAIRARTKEHIERLERELEELKGKHSRDHTVQELMRRNKALEDELLKLKESMGIPIARPYSAPGYDDNLSVISGAVPSPRSSPFPSSADYHVMPDFSHSYVPMPEEHWASVMPCSVPSSVSSPSSSGHTDEYGGPYIPTSVPTSVMDSTTIQGPAVACLPGKDVKVEYDEIDHEPGYPLSTSTPMSQGYMHHHHQQQPQHHQHHQHHQQPWNMYQLYYTQSSAH